MGGERGAGPRRFAWRHKALLGIAGASALVLLGAGAGFVLLLSGSYDTAATKQHFVVTHRLLEAGLLYSIRTAARDVVVPPLGDPAMVVRGASCFRTHCTQCHDAPGIARDAEGKGMMPIPSNLAQSARDWPAAWLYEVTKKGVRMTGMPAWEFRLSEESLWSTVAFLKTLPSLTADRYRALDARARDTDCPPNDAPAAQPTPARSRVLLAQYGCQSCHRIEGIVGPDSLVGPPLADWSRQKYIAGVLPNTADNLVRWLMDPQSVSAQTLMPDLGVPEAHAREMAAYLLSLR
jgi:mono/diheme cytochrome c family protein